MWVDGETDDRPSRTVAVTIVCLEGPSGVGKTTTATAFCEAFDAVRVPEVDALFERPADAPDDWYHERQCDRWRRAVDAEADHDVVVLDGDVFQSLWYNWFATHAPADGPGPFASLETVHRRYERRLRERRVGFPDRYLVLGASEATLRRRAEGDETRTRRNFEYHLGLVAPQRAYFEALGAFAPGLVRFRPATTVADGVDALAAVSRVSPASTDRYDGGRLTTVAAWLATTTPPNG